MVSLPTSRCRRRHLRTLALTTEKRLTSDSNYFDRQPNAIADDVFNCRDTAPVTYNYSSYRFYSFRLPGAANVTNKIRGLAAISYLNDFAGAQYKYFTSDIQLSQAAAMKLSIHAPGTGSKIQVAEKVGPGKEVLVHLSQTKYTRLLEPLGNVHRPLES